MATKRRYYSDEDYVGKTPAALKRLSRARQREYLKHWFHRNYEDPQNETPYADKDDDTPYNYNYIWGGPYEAKDELWGEFGDFLPESLIDEVVEEVEGDGIIEWAPGKEHPDMKQSRENALADEPPFEPDHINIEDIIRTLESGARTPPRDGYEKQLRQEALDSLERLKAALTPPKPVHGGRGHNHPPPDVEQATADAIAEIQTAVDLLVAEFKKPEPDALAVAKETKRLGIVGRWAAVKADRFVDSFTTTLGITAATATTAALGAAAVHLGPEITHLVTAVMTHLCNWLGHIVQPI